jgi:hypothetical protein
MSLIDDAKRVLELDATGSTGVWQEGVAGNTNLVAYDGDDVKGVGRVDWDANRRLIIAYRTLAPYLARAVLAAEEDKRRAVRNLEAELARLKGGEQCSAAGWGVPSYVELPEGGFRVCPACEALVQTEDGRLIPHGRKK